MQEYIKVQSTQLLKQNLEQIKNNIDYKINVYDELMSNIASDKSLTFALSRKYNSPADYTYDYLNIYDKVFQIKAKYKYIIGMYIYKNNDTLPQDGRNMFDMANVRDTWWFMEFFPDTETFNTNDFIRLWNSKTWIVTNEDLRQKYNSVKKEALEKRIVVFKPIINNYERLVGILEVDIKYDSVFGEYQGDKNFTDTNFFVLDDGMEIIFNDAKKTAPSTLKQYTAQSGNGRNSQELIIDNKLVIHAKSQYTNWEYYKEIPLNELLESAKSVQSFTIANGLSSIFISFIIGLILANIISRRISRLSDKMSQIEDLSLDINVQIDGKDEIGVLAKNFNKMIRNIRKLVDDLKISHQQLKETEIKALQAQINPHFLYNTLAAINWMAMGNRNKDIIAMINSLSTFYSLSLSKGKECIKISEEFSLTKAYADIQMIRWEDKLKVHFQISENIGQYYTLKLVLQPFVENSIIHGAEYKIGKITNIVIRGYKEENRIVLEVVDDGIGIKEIPESDRYSETTGYGIRNVHEKIQLQYGYEYGVRIFSKLGIGTQVLIYLPIIESC